MGFTKRRIHYVHIFFQYWLIKVFPFELENDQFDLVLLYSFLQNIDSVRYYPRARVSRKYLYLCVMYKIPHSLCKFRRCTKRLNDETHPNFVINLFAKPPIHKFIMTICTLIHRLSYNNVMHIHPNVLKLSNAMSICTTKNEYRFVVHHV